MGRRRGPKAKSSPLSAPLPPLLEASTLGGGGGEEGEEEEEEASEVWKPYQCKSIAFGEKHPGSLVEGAALAAIELPPNSYPLQDSLGFQIQTGRLSSMQLEGVMYACERHSRKLPGGARAGFLLNDSAGVGKGRQVAGIIVDNLVRARPRHVWFSVSKDLHLDASRDFQDLGCTVQVIPSVAKLTTTKTDSNGSVVFCTYTELISKGRAKSNDTRYDELVDWLCGGKTPELRENFDGCLIFDESHKAKNVVEGKKESTAVSSKTGELVVRIQTDLPNARVVYSSATGIIGIESMGYLVRMGLWGENTSFRTFGDFWNCFGGSKGNAGFGSLEMLALNFKASGCSVARSVGYYGATFDTVHAPLSKEVAQMYRQAVVWMRDLLESISQAQALCEATPEGDYRHAQPQAKATNSRIMSMYWGAHLRFMRQLISGIKVPILVQTARDAIRDGHCVVIGLQTTNEAYLKQYSGEHEYKIVLSSCRLIMNQFLEKWFPIKQTWQRIPHVDPPQVLYRIASRDLTRELALICKHVDHLDSKMFVRQVYDYVYESPINVPAYREDGTVIDCEVMRRELQWRLDSLLLPGSALDDLMDQLGGPQYVAEMTGRGIRQVRSTSTGLMHIQKRLKDSSMENSLNVQEQRAFQHGRKLVAIISEAASTGISLHADKSKPNQRRRVHCTLELPWQAQQAIQQLGRSHRTNQVTAPMFKLVSSGLGGEHRFLSSISKRLQSLGALTQGNRKASLGSLSFGEFQYESEHGRRALKLLYHSIIAREFPTTLSFTKLINNSKEQIQLDSSPELNQFETWCAPPARGVSEIKTPEQFFDLVQEPLCILGGFALEFMSPFELAERKSRKQHVMIKPLQVINLIDDDVYVVEDDQDSKPCTIASKEEMILKSKEGKKAAVTALDVPRFFNRILGLPLCQQSLLFNYFCLLLEADIKDAKLKGKFDRGLQTLDATTITRICPEERIYHNLEHGHRLVLHSLIKDRGVDVFAAFREIDYRIALQDGVVQAKRSDFVIPINLPTEQAYTELIAKCHKHVGFYRSREPLIGRYRVCLAIRLSMTAFAIVRPATGVTSSSQMDVEALRKNYREMDTVKEIQKTWMEEYNNQDCFHGKRCKVGFECQIGRRRQALSILSGSVIPFWGELQGLAKAYSQTELSIVQTNITETGERIVGVLVEFAVDRLKLRISELQARDDRERNTVRLVLPVNSCLPASSTSMPWGRSSCDEQICTTQEQLEMFGFAWSVDNSFGNGVVHTSTVPQVVVGYVLRAVLSVGLLPSSGRLVRHPFTSPLPIVSQHKFEFLRPTPPQLQQAEEEKEVQTLGLKAEEAAAVVPRLLQALIVESSTAAVDGEEGWEDDGMEEEDAIWVNEGTSEQEEEGEDGDEEEVVVVKKPKRSQSAKPTTTTTITTTTTTTTILPTRASSRIKAQAKDAMVVVEHGYDLDEEEEDKPKPSRVSKNRLAPVASSSVSGRRSAVKKSYTDYYDEEANSNAKPDSDQEFESQVFAPVSTVKRYQQTEDGGA